MPINFALDLRSRAPRRNSNVERLTNIPLSAHALGHNEAVATLDEGLGLALIGIVQVLAMLPADLDGVSKTLGRDEGGFGVVPLDQRVRRSRRSVHQIADVI